MSELSAREEILERIRRANANAGVTAARPMSSSASASTPRRAVEDSAALIDQFAERVEDYRAVVERCQPSDVAERVASAVASAHGVIVPDGFPQEWASRIDADSIRSDPGSPAELDTVEAVVTTSAAGIAQTGTIVLNHTAGQGRRALTLVPDLHVCIVRAHDLHADVPQAVSALRAPVDAGQPLTWISGPSATSDIELSRVEGVHGPRRLHVIIVS